MNVICIVAYFLFLFSPLSIFAHSLSSILMLAQKGHYALYTIDGAKTLLFISYCGNDRISIDEVIFDKKKEISFAPPFRGHTSWKTMAYNTKTHLIDSFFDQDRQQKLPIEQCSGVFASLLEKELSRIPDNERKRIGPEPIAGETDHRKFWVPQIIEAGKKREGEVTPYRVYLEESALHPRAIVELYLETANPFPVAIQLHSSSIHKLILREDSGKVQ